MKCKIFYGTPANVAAIFNKWAKGKALSKDVIIHSIADYFPTISDVEPTVIIVVYHPEDEHWDEVVE